MTPTGTLTPMPALTLIQTVGQQTMPALTGVLGYQPASAVHIFASEDAAASRRVEVASKLAGIQQTSWVHVAVSNEDLLGNAEAAACHAIEKARSAGSAVLINLTGGTKLLAIGAYRAAMRLNVPCIYLELPQGDLDGLPQIVHFGETDPRITAPRDPAPTLNLEVLAAANGYTLVDAGDDPARYRPLANALLADFDAEEMTHLALPRAIQGKVPFPNAPEWKRWLEPFVLPTRIADAAEEAGVVERAGDRWALGSAERGAPDHVRRQTLERNASLLNGAWVEIALHAALAEHTALRDVRWSVLAENPRPLEHDVLALKGTQLLLASCKRSTQPGIFGHLRELSTHASRLGGLKAIKAICIARIDTNRRADGTGTVGSDLTEVCESLGITLITGADLRRRQLPEIA